MSSAHARGIVHRDLKPSNVRIAPDGRVKILDLGLAKMVIADANATPNRHALEDARTLAVETREGTVLGTPAYMSPEQAVGAPVDARTDVWAFGAVLFEMLSGRRAFPGTTITEILACRVAWRRGLGGAAGRRAPSGPALDRTLSRARSIRPLERSRRGAERAAAVRQSGVRHRRRDTPADTKSIVVLPFANLSPDPDTEYFSDGLTDEIITDLSRVRSLRVISRSSAMRLKGDARGLAAIGRDLACRYVLEGSVRRAANTLRITARLVDAPNDVQLWADKYGGRWTTCSTFRSGCHDRSWTPSRSGSRRKRPSSSPSGRSQTFAPRSATSVRRARSGASFPALWTGRSAIWKPRSGWSATTPCSTRDSVWRTSST